MKLGFWKAIFHTIQAFHETRLPKIGGLRDLQLLIIENFQLSNSPILISYSIHFSISFNFLVFDYMTIQHGLYVCYQSITS